MDIKDFLKKLEWSLLANKWKIRQIDEFYRTFENIHLFDEPIIFSLPVKTNSSDFVLQLRHSLRILKQLDSRRVHYSILKELSDFINLYERRFSKEKNKWIVPENESKYIDSEIPYIYVP